MTAPDRLSRLRALLEETLADPIFTDPGHRIAMLASNAHSRAVQLLALRRRRQFAFGANADLLGDPAWDMLLDLFVNRGRRLVTVSSACLAARVPQTTALRWLKTIEGRGLVRRNAHPSDQRSSYVELTEQGVALMIGALDDGLIGCDD